MADEQGRHDRVNAPWAGFRWLVHLICVALAALLLSGGCRSNAATPEAGTGGKSTQAMADDEQRRLRIPGEPATLVDLADLDVLKGTFNEHGDVPQLILLLSPTRGECLVGASWVHQEILRKHPVARFQVYAIWMPMLPTDARGEWDPQLLNDPRVLHFWDDRRLAGQRFGEEVERPVEWDAYFLYDQGAAWEDGPSKLVGSGRTVIGRSDDLEREITPLLR